MDTVAPNILTDLKVGAHPGFVIGSDDRPADNVIVAYALRLRADQLRAGDREFSASNLCFHEMALCRRFYEEQQGSCRISAGWPPGLPRAVALTTATLRAELERMRITYILPREGQNVELVPMFLGSIGEQLKNLQALCIKQHAAWKKLVATALTRLPADTQALHPSTRESMACDLISEREIEQIIGLGDPTRQETDDVFLAPVDQGEGTASPSVKAATAKEAQLSAAALADRDALIAAMRGAATTEPEATSPLEAMVDKMTASGVSSAHALGIAALVDSRGEAYKVTDAEIIEVLGNKGKLAAVRAALL